MLLRRVYQLPFWGNFQLTFIEGLQTQIGFLEGSLLLCSHTATFVRSWPFHLGLLCPRTDSPVPLVSLGGIADGTLLVVGILGESELLFHYIYHKTDILSCRFV